MSTPAEHATAAATYIAWLDGTTHKGTTPSYEDQRAGEAHAILSKKAGTGSHYAAAETALAAFDAPTGKAFLDRVQLSESAKIHALLAD